MENSQEDFDTVFDDFINYPNDMQPGHGYIGEGTAGFALEQQGFNCQAQSFPSTFEPALDSSRFQNQQYSLPPSTSNESGTVTSLTTPLSTLSPLESNNFPLPKPNNRYLDIASSLPYESEQYGLQHNAQDWGDSFQDVAGKSDSSMLSCQIF